jgi:hypothetical protein
VYVRLTIHSGRPWVHIHIIAFIFGCHDTDPPYRQQTALPSTQFQAPSALCRRLPACGTCFLFCSKVPFHQPLKNCTVATATRKWNHRLAFKALVINYLLTTRVKVFPGKLVVAQQVIIKSTILLVFTKPIVNQLNDHLDTVSLISILILSSNLCPGLLCGVFPQGFTISTLYAFPYLP